MADRIPDFSNKVRNSIAEELRGRLVCLKVDGVTKSTRHFIGINVQYIKDAKIVVRTLGVREMFSRHTALNIKSEILSSLDSFQLSVRNLLSSTTDTGANMIKLAELLQLAQIEDFDDIGLIEWFPECDLDPSDATLQTVKCAAHTLQLAVHDAIKNSEETAAILKKARNAACALRKPNRVKELRKQGHAMPVLDVSTRWGSSFDMLESVLAVKEYAVAHESEDDLLCLTDEEWQLVENVIDALRPAREATIILQGK